MASITGTSASTMRRFKTFNGQRIEVQIKSKPLYGGPGRGDYSEVIALKLFCEFRDTNDYSISILSDLMRATATGEYNALEFVRTELAAAGQPYFRHHIKVIPQEGDIVGSLFQYLIEKKIADNGFFKFFGAELSIVPKPFLDSEFIQSMGAATDGW